MTDFLMVKNWDKYQHYKKDNPTWIKLYTNIMDDYHFSLYNDSRKLIVLLLFLLAAKTNNKIPNNPDLVKKQLRIDADIDLQTFVNDGFLLPYKKIYRESLEKDYKNSIQRREEKRRKRKIQPPAVSQLVAIAPEEKNAVRGIEVSRKSQATTEPLTGETLEPDEDEAAGDNEPDLDDEPDFDIDHFEKIWDRWPKKEKYLQARRLWNKLRLPEKIQRKIFDDIPDWGLYAGWNNKNGIYAPRLVNYLKDQGWNDDPPRRKFTQI